MRTTTEYLSEKEALDVFGICRTTLWILRKKGLPHYKVGSLIRYDLSEIKDYLRVPPTEQSKKGDDRDE